MKTAANPTEPSSLARLRQADNEMKLKVHIGKIIRLISREGRYRTGVWFCP